MLLFLSGIFCIRFNSSDQFQSIRTSLLDVVTIACGFSGLDRIDCVFTAISVIPKYLFNSSGLHAVFIWNYSRDLVLVSLSPFFFFLRMISRLCPLARTGLTGLAASTPSTVQRALVHHHMERHDLARFLGIKRSNRARANRNTHVNEKMFRKVSFLKFHLIFLF